MADYNAILDTQLDPDAPLTSDLAYAWRDNPIAIAEGALNAPKVVGEALDNVWRAYLTGTTTTPVSLTGLGRVQKLRLCLTHIFGGAVNVRISFSADGGSTWGAFQIISSGDGGGGNGGRVSELVIDLGTGAMTGGSSGYAAAANQFSLVNSTLTVPANVNAVRFDLTSTGASFGVNVYAIEGRP